MIRVIAGREIRAYFATPVVWILTGAAQFILAWLLLKQLDVYQQIEARLSLTGAVLGISDLVTIPTFSSAALMLILLTPVLGMRVFADELASGRIRMLLAAPVSAADLVIGKWLALVAALLPLVILVLAMGWVLGVYSSLDVGRLAGAGLGLLLLLALNASVTVFTSTLTSQHAIAAILAYALLVLVWVIDNPGRENLFNWFALLPHLQPMLQGSIRLTGLIYFISGTLFMLALSVFQVWRWRNGR